MVATRRRTALSARAARGASARGARSRSSSCSAEEGHIRESVFVLVKYFFLSPAYEESSLSHNCALALMIITNE